MPLPYSPSPWIRQYQRVRGGVPTLVCFPHAGGSASFFHSLASALSPNVCTLAIQYPGRQDRHNEPGITDLGVLVSHITRELSSLVGSESASLAFFGHSMGALLAFEVAVQMERSSSGGPNHLLVSGRRPPSRPYPQDQWWLTDEQLIRRMAMLNSIDEATLNDPDVMAMALPALRADHMALAGHTPDPDARVSCPITIITGDRDPLLSIPDANAWSAHTDAGCETHVLPGGHFYLKEHPTEVTRLISEAIRC